MSRAAGTSAENSARDEKNRHRKKSRRPKNTGRKAKKLFGFFNEKEPIKLF
jgi:hypothetical protein